MEEIDPRLAQLADSLFFMKRYNRFEEIFKKYPLSKAFESGFKVLESNEDELVIEQASFNALLPANSILETIADPKEKAEAEQFCIELFRLMVLQVWEKFRPTDPALKSKVERGIRKAAHVKRHDADVALALIGLDELEEIYLKSHSGSETEPTAAIKKNSSKVTAGNFSGDNPDNAWVWQGGKELGMEKFLRLVMKAQWVCSKTELRDAFNGNGEKFRTVKVPGRFYPHSAYLFNCLYKLKIARLRRKGKFLEMISCTLVDEKGKKISKKPAEYTSRVRSGKPDYEKVKSLVFSLLEDLGVPKDKLKENL